MRASTNKSIESDGIGTKPSIADLLEKLTSRARNHKAGLRLGIDESVEAHKIRGDAPGLHLFKKLLDVVETGGAGVDAHHGIINLDGDGGGVGLRVGAASEEFLGDEGLASAAEDGENGGEEARAGGVAAVKGEPFEDLERAAPVDVADGFDDEAEVGGGHLHGT